MKTYTQYLSEDFPYAYASVFGVCLGYKIAQCLSYDSMFCADEVVTMFLFYNFWFAIIAFYKWRKQYWSMSSARDLL